MATNLIVNVLHESHQSTRFINISQFEYLSFQKPDESSSLEERGSAFRIGVVTMLLLLLVGTSFLISL